MPKRSALVFTALLVVFGGWNLGFALFCDSNFFEGASFGFSTYPNCGVFGIGLLALFAGAAGSGGLAIRVIYFLVRHPNLTERKLREEVVDLAALSIMCFCGLIVTLVVFGYGKTT